MQQRYLQVLTIALVVALTGCRSGSDSGSSSAPVAPPVVVEPTSIYSVAKGCYNLQSLASDGYVTVSGDGYSADNSSQRTAEAFFVQAATLGKYLFYAADKRMLTAGAGTVAGVSEPSDAAIWSLAYDEDSEVFTITSDATGDYLAVSGSGDLITSQHRSANSEFQFVPATTTCTPYPEMPVGVSGPSYKGNGVNQPIIGFAEVHTHMGMSSEMSYDDSVGPSAGGVLYGQIFHRFGVTHALENCEDFHGPDGIHDANNVLETDPTGTHDTVGWPTFIDWPARNFLTHQVMYYRWVERAWRAGLRVMVNHGTNIKALCEIGRSYAGKPDADCEDMSIAIKQIEYLYELQDYVDAQSGGPGEGWFRIVTSPMQAREVINDGKLAVILGVEVAEVFDCGVQFLPDGSEIRNCDSSKIDQQINMLWDLGVRHVYPYHDIDSSLGGTGIFSGDVINFLNFKQTNRFWETQACDDYPEGPLVREPGAEMTTAFPGTGDDPLTSAFYDSIGGVMPVYPPGRRCNARTVTDLGHHALQALMDKHMIIDIDHAAYYSKNIMLDLAEQQDPPYPMASSHDAHGGLTSDQAIRMLRAGGTIYPYKGNGKKHKDFLEKVKYWREQAGLLNDERHLALGYGADGNGFGGHPGPRGGDSTPVQYPFTLFEGEGWGPQFRNIQPATVDMLTIPESGKFWNIDEVGMAHYGLVADFVEEVRLESGQEGISALYNSAEDFIQMWERVWNRD